MLCSVAHSALCLQDAGLKQALEEAACAVIGTSLSVPQTPVLSDQPGADALTQLSLGPVVSQAAATTSKQQHARESLIHFLARSYHSNVLTELCCRLQSSFVAVVPPDCTSSGVTSSQ